MDNVDIKPLIVQLWYQLFKIIVFSLDEELEKRHVKVLQNYLVVV